LPKCFAGQSTAGFGLAADAQYVSLVSRAIGECLEKEQVLRSADAQCDDWLEIDFDARSIMSASKARAPSAISTGTSRWWPAKKDAIPQRECPCVRGTAHPPSARNP
jgi:hypothetical protein